MLGLKKVLVSFDGASCLKSTQIDNIRLVPLVESIIEILGNVHPRFKLKRTIGPLRVKLRFDFRSIFWKVLLC